MFPFFAATGLFLFYCACIPVKLAFAVRFNGHTSFGAGISIFEGRRAMKAAILRANGKKPHLKWKKSEIALKKNGLLSAAYHTTRHLLRHAELEQLQLSGVLSLPNAAQTALLCGAVQILQGILLPFAPKGSVHLHPRPDFSCRGCNAALQGMISIPAGHIMLAALKGAWHYLHSSRRNPSHGKASD